MAFTTEKDYSGRGEGGELTPQEEIFIQNLAAQCVYDNNKVVRLNSNNGGSAMSILKVDNSGNYLVWGSVNWGEITGTLSDQTDLQNALNQKANDSIVLKKDGSVALTSNWNVDGAGTLYIDKTNGRIGVGTTTPQTNLDVNGGENWHPVNIEGSNASGVGIALLPNGTYPGYLISGNSGNLFQISQLTDSNHSTPNLTVNVSTGNVGIGTTNPSAQLHISHGNNTPTAGVGAVLFIDAGTNFYNAEFKGSDAYNGLFISNTASSGVPFVQFKNIANSKTWTIQLESNKTFAIREGNVAGNTRFMIAEGGSVGIGTTTPSQTLDVENNSTSNGQIFLASNNGNYAVAGITFSTPYSGSQMGGIYNSWYGNNPTINGTVHLIGGMTFISPRDLDNGTIGSVSPANWGFRFDSQSGVTRMFIDTASGNVGIGTTAPAYKLDVVGEGRFTGSNLYVGGTSGRIYADSTNLVLQGPSNAYIAPVGVDGTRVEMNSGNLRVGGPSQTGANLYVYGNVGIGTTGPVGILTINGGSSGRITLASYGDTNANTPRLEFFGDPAGRSAVGPAIQGISSGAYGRHDLVFYQHNVDDYSTLSEVMRLTASGNLGIGTTTPGAKLHVSGNVKVNGILYIADPTYSSKIYYEDSGGKFVSHVSRWSGQFDWRMQSSGEISRTLASLFGSPDAGSVYLDLFSQTAGTSAVRLNTNGNSYFNGGNVGIGTTTPGARLDVQNNVTGYTNLVNVQNTIDPGTGATGLQVSNPASTLLLRAYGSTAPGVLASAAGIVSTAGSGFVIGGGTSITTYIYSYNNYTNPELTIKNGSIGIGTTSPSVKLDVNGNAYVRGNLTTMGGAGTTQVSLNTNSATWTLINNINDGNKFEIFYNANSSSPALIIQGNNYIGIGTTTPQQPLTLSSGSTFATDMAIPTGVSSSTAASGTLNGTYYYKVSASDGIGWTKLSSEVSQTVDGGTTAGTINVSWTAVTGATKYRVWRGTSAGGENQYYETTATSISDNGSLTFTSGTAPTVTTAYVDKITSSGNSWLLGGSIGIGTTNPSYKCHISGTFGFTPGSSVTPANNGDVVIEATNNTTLTFKLKGSDGTVRTATLTLS